MDELGKKVSKRHRRSMLKTVRSNGNGSVHGNGNGNGHGRLTTNPLVLAGEHGTQLAADLSTLSTTPALEHGTYPSFAETRPTTVGRNGTRRDADSARRLSRVRDLGAGVLRGPLLRLLAVIMPIAVVLLTSAYRLPFPELLAPLALLTAVWLAMQHAANASARLSPFVVGVWAKSMIGAVNGAVAAAAICLLLPGLGVRSPQVLLMLAGVLTMSYAAESLSLRLGRHRRLLLVGVSEGATELVRDLAANPKLPFQWVGAVAEDVRPDAAFPIPLLGTMADLPRIVLDARPDLVVVVDVEQRDQAIEHLLGVAKAGFRIVGLPEIYEYAFGRVPVRDLPHAWFMSLLHLYQRPYSRFAARSVDLVVATVGLVLTAPLFPLIATLVRWSGPGPILFRQKRVGEGGTLFEMIKFRTMIDGAEQNGAAVWAAERDSRVTGIGRFLRNTRLDELPQLWNVLCGEMSIIGPRPERPEFLELLEREVPFWGRRLLVKPGITGWAQVQRGYAADAIGAAEKLSYDLYYLKHRSMLLDFAIVAKTAGAVLNRSGAR
ncbi:MAG TPA: sugar transferase [Gaiellaceae bacterium]|nr:sugar transferase [Gaiellaceae bacterium]